MRKRALIVFVLALLIFNVVFLVSAVDDDTTTDDTTADATTDDEAEEGTETTITQEATDLSGVDKAFECLKNSVEDKCSSLSFEEKAFTVLTLGECKDELIADSTSGECWPKSGCNVKDTALAIWALNNRDENTEAAENWLFSQNATPDEVSWFLEIESPGETTCKITYSDAEYTIGIGEDKTINSDAGSCLTRSVGNYWLRVSPSCYDREFEVSCGDSFLTTLLYKRRDSSVIHVSENTHSSSAEGKTSEKVNAVCFANGGVCDYEGTLWASLILDSRSNNNYELSSYLPYLITMADQNENLLPEAFLYLLTDHEDYRNDLLSKQRKSQYWDEGGNKFYDTALALLPFSGSIIQEKQSAIDWLLEVQDKNGCFNNGNKRDTAFILYSLWSEKVPAINEVSSKSDCEASEKYCMSAPNCATENVLAGYSCSGAFKCCSVPMVEKTCTDLVGEICNSNQICSGSNAREDSSASDLSFGEVCCIGGSCETGAVAEENECEESGFSCRDSGCQSDEEALSYQTCEFASQTCCKKSAPDPGRSYLWLWIVLILLIIAIIVAIIFRDKLRPYWYKVTSKFGKDGPKPPSRGQRPSSGFNRPAPGQLRRNPIPSRPQSRPPIQRRTLPMNRPGSRITPRQKPRPELNETLNKIKKLSKE